MWYGPKRTGKVPNDDRVDWTEAWALFPGDIAYVWHAALSTGEVAGHLAAVGFVVRSHLIWRKHRPAISRGHYHWQHEPCWYAVRKGKTAKWSGDRKQNTMWDITVDKNVEGDHGTQKPVECMARPMRNHGELGDGVYDPFVGSGTTLVAAQQQGRVCFALDIDPGYVAVTLERWAEMTGHTPTLG